MHEHSTLSARFARNLSIAKTPSDIYCKNFHRHIQKGGRITHSILSQIESTGFQKNLSQIIFIHLDEKYLLKVFFLA
jgi:hypothetical protein